MNNTNLLLKTLKISGKEFEVYQTLYASGSMTVAELSKKLSIPRTTVYQYVEHSLSKGLVTHTFKGARKNIVAELPTRIETLIREYKVKAEGKLKEIEQIEKSLPVLMDQFNIIIPNKNTLPQTNFRYYEGKTNTARVYDDILQYPELRTYVDHDQITIAFPENVEKFNAAMSKGVKVYDILFYNQPSPQPDFIGSDCYFFKYFPKNAKIDYMDYIIYGDSIAIIQAGSTPSAIVIQNKILATNAKTIYDVIWNLLPAPSKIF